jgi:hypothetical protein
VHQGGTIDAKAVDIAEARVESRDAIEGDTEVAEARKLNGEARAKCG